MDAAAITHDDDSTLIPLPVLLTPEPQYRCPDELHTISRSVHLARLAAFYPKCRHCQHRHDTGNISPAVVERIQSVEQQRAPQRSIFEANGVRGVFLNQITPAIAGQIAGALASLLWEQAPLVARIQTAKKNTPKRSGPLVAIGYDERPSSPALFAAVADQLRLMGCQVVDVGQVARPCFNFAVDHLQAVGGIYVTGAGKEAAWTGLDLVAERALPLSSDTGLELVERRFREGYSRATRRAGFQRSFQSVLPYEAGLWKHFHALRPLRVVAAIRPRSIRATVRRLFAKLPCELFEVETSATPQAPLRHEVVLEELGRRVVKREAHLGILIDDDGSECRLIDERGQLIDSLRLTAFLANLLLTEHPQSEICVASESIAALKPLLKTERVLDGGSTRGSMSEVMQSSHAVFGGGESHLYWHREAYPSCDAILTLARVLQGLSRSDAAFSAVLLRK